METFTMSRKEVLRAGLIKAALAGKITNAEGARALHVSERHFKRLKRRFCAEGVAGLVHRGRGQPSPRRLAPECRARVIALMTTTYAGFNDVHLTEKLQERHTLPVSRATVRRLRVALGRPSQRRRRPPKHRSRRPRATALGQLVQLDASVFPWFGAQHPAATLHGLIDDATSIPLALWFRPTEDLHGYVTLLDQVCRTYGVPVTLYGDRLNLFQRNDRHWTREEQLQGRQAPTHFGQMLEDLAIGFIAAQSPQAKGRIERLWQTLQDRLVSELRLRGIVSLEAANAFLPEFLADFRPRFGRSPATPAPAWRPAPRDLDHVLSCRYARTVARDNTITLGPRWMQIPPGPADRSFAHCAVDVRELLDGRLLVFYQGVLLASQPAPDAPFTLKPRAAPRHARTLAQRSPRRRGATDLAPGIAAAAPAVTPAPRPPSSKPASDHPWRVPFSSAQRRRQQQRLAKG
jgi:hypothetical protein